MNDCCVPGKKFECQSLIVMIPALFAFAVAASWASGQAAQPSPSQAVDMLVKAEEVSVDLVVDDKNNKPILDLKPEELEITDDKSPVKLNSLLLMRGKQESDHLITLVFDGTSRLAETGHKVNLSSAKIERDAAAKILKMVPENGFSISVLNVEGRLRLQQGFTHDRKALAQAINAATGLDKSASGGSVNEPEKQMVAELQAGTNSSGKPASAAEHTQALALYSALSQSGKIAQDQHIRPSLAGLLALEQAMQRVPHRKTVIFFTSFQKTQADSRARDAMQSIIGSADQAGLSIYVVDLSSSDRIEKQLTQNDLQGLGVDMPNQGGAGSGASGSTAPTGGIPEPFVTRVTESYGETIDKYPDNNADLQHLAEGTGGRYVTNNRIDESLKRMIQDMTTYYEASYRFPIKEYDGKFHSVAVKSLRHGLKIRYQTGYLAMPPQAVAGDIPQPFELPLLKILMESFLPTDLIFRAAILRMEDRPEGNVNTLAIEAPLSSLEIREDSSTNLYSAHLSIVANIKDKTGAVVEHFSADIPRRGALKDIGMTKYEAISMDRHFTVAPGQYLLEVAVLDQNSGKAGAQRISFEIPNASAMPSLSDIVLVRPTGVVLAEEDRSDPLRHGNDKVIPNLSGQLPPGAKEVSVFLIAHSDKHAAGAATLNIQVLQDGKPLGNSEIAAKQTEGSEFSSYLTRFSIDPTMAGQYEVKAILNQEGRSAQAGTTFTLAGTRQSSTNEADPNLPALDTVAHPAGPLVITFPETPIQAPRPEEIQAILADARQFAMEYKSLLPNFVCTQITNRSVDLTGSMEWKHKDKLTERLTYVNHEENRILLEVDTNGIKSHTGTEGTRGLLSAGEFGVVLSGLFRPESKTDFTWKKTGVLGDETVQEFDYRVARENSTLNLRISANDVVTVGYHGQVFIESVTRRVRRVTQVADDVPKTIPIHATSVSVDYDYIVINKHDYLLPVGAEILLRKGRRETDLNEIEFRNFRRFGSNVRILDPTSTVTP
jgi:VWFA-related protein